MYSHRAFQSLAHYFLQLETFPVVFNGHFYPVVSLPAQKNDFLSPRVFGNIMQRLASFSTISGKVPGSKDFAK